MPSTIQIKRGSKNSLPSLAVGELAFTTNSKELYIGSDTGNIVLTKYKDNILPNGNFQVATTTLDYNNTASPLGANAGRYAYGPYYIFNSNTAGSITYTNDFTGTGRLKFTLTNATLELHYRVKLNRTIPNGTTYSYSSPFEGHTVTLSFDYVNPLSTPYSFSYGKPGSLITGSLPANSSGRFFGSFTFNKTILSTLTYPTFNVTIFKAASSATCTLEIGNIKLEDGGDVTAFYPNPIQKDIILVRESYYEYGFSMPSSIMTTTSFIFYFDTRAIPSYYDQKFDFPDLTLINQTGASWTSIFTRTTSYDSAKNLLTVTMTKTDGTAHGFTSGYIFGIVQISNQP